MCSFAAKPPGSGPGPCMQQQEAPVLVQELTSALGNRVQLLSCCKDADKTASSTRYEWVRWRLPALWCLFVAQQLP